MGQADDNSMAGVRIESPAALRGEVAVRGAKNAALPILMAVAAGGELVVLDDVPTKLLNVGAELEHVGCRTDVCDARVELAAPDQPDTSVPAELAGRFRSSLLFLGLLAGKWGRAEDTMPGGCDLGDRKFDLRLEGLRRLGAEVRLAGQTIEFTAERLVGTDIDFYLPTTTGAENIMLAAEGATVEGSDEP